MNRVLRVELLIDNCLDDRLTNGGTASVSLMAAFIMATTCSLVITSCRSNRLFLPYEAQASWFEADLRPACH